MKLHVVDGTEPASPDASFAARAHAALISALSEKPLTLAIIYETATGCGYCGIPETVGTMRGLLAVVAADMESAD